MATLVNRLVLPAISTVLSFFAFHFSQDDGGFIALIHYVSGILGWMSLAWFGSRIVDSLLDQTGTPRLLNDLLHATFYILASIAIFVFVFQKEATGLIATSSVLIAVIGFAMRNIISDVFSGIVLNFDHPYRLGDWIEPAQTSLGKVTEITWRSTRLITRDGVTIIMPNGLIATGRLTNFSGNNGPYRINARLWLDARLPIEHAKKMLLMGALRALRTYPDLRPDVLVQDVGDSGILYVVRFWVPDAGEENACRDMVISMLMQAMQRSGVALAAPKRALTVIQTDEDVPPSLSLPSRETVLDQCDLFQVFTQDDRDEMAHHLLEHPMKKGDTVFERGAPGGTLYFIADGTLEVRTPATAVSPGIALDRLVPGDIFGEISFLTGEPRSASVIATSDALLYEITKDAIEPFLWRRPELFDTLAALMVERQRHNRTLLDTAAKPSQADLTSRIRKFFKKW